MKKFIVAILLFILGLPFLNAQSKTEVLTIAIRPIDGKGFNGKLDFEYSFSQCFGETHMFYSFSNVEIYSFEYMGKSYTSNQLGIDSFKNYLIVPDIYIAKINKPVEFFKNGNPRYGGVDGGIQSTIMSNLKLDNVLNSQIGGCGGQTKKIGKYKKVEINSSKLTDKEHLDPKYIYLPIEESINSIYNKNYANFSWEATLSEKIKCIINPENCNRKDKDTDQSLITNNKLKKYYLKYYLDINASANGESYISSSYVTAMVLSNCIDLKSKKTMLENKIKKIVSNNINKTHNFGGMISTYYDIQSLKLQDNSPIQEVNENYDIYYEKDNFLKKYWVHEPSKISEKLYTTANNKNFLLYLDFDCTDNNYVKENDDIANLDLGKIIQNFQKLPYNEQISMYTQAIKELENNKQLQITFYQLRGDAYMKNKEYINSIEDNLKGVEIAKKLGDKKLLAASYYNLGIPYLYTNQSSVGVSYITKACKEYNLEVACTYLEEFNRLNKN